jgi:tripartite ATP-independent transporter DctM subunit
MSGSAIADAVGIGRIIIGMMTRDGKYPVAYAAAITASAAIIGPIIPPSIPMVIYALVSDASIGYLFLGGVIPGLLLGVAFMVMNGILARRRNYPVEPPVPLREIPRATVNAFPALLLPVILLFGIYGGVMTPTEGAAAAAAYALLAAALIYRAMTWRQLYGVLLSSAKATTSVGMLIAGALVFNYVVTIENIPPPSRRSSPASTCRRSRSCCSSTRSCWSWAVCSRARPSCSSSCPSSSRPPRRWASTSSTSASW